MLNDLLKDYKNKLKVQETKMVKMDQERSELTQTLNHQRVAATKLVEELKECKGKLNSYGIEITNLKDLVKELDNMKAKVDEYKNPSEELVKLRKGSTTCEIAHNERGYK